MENPTGVTNIGTTSPQPSFLSSTTSTVTKTASNAGGFFSNIDWKVWLLLFVILAFLGFNIFTFLSQQTQTATNFLQPVVGNLANLFKSVINVSAKGAEKGVNVTADVIDSGLEQVQKVTDGTPGSARHSEEETHEENDESLNHALSNAATTKPQDIPGDKPTYEADDSYSVIQSSKSTGKSGWCYVGEDRGFRTCVEVGENDRCMSGDIFPTKDVCVNPNLRP